MSRSSGENRQVVVTVYRITGRQLFFDIGKSICEECDLTVAAVARAIRELEGVDVKLSVKAWLNNLPIALARGAYHPPVLLVDNRVISQGVVPATEYVKQAIVNAVRIGNGQNLRRLRSEDALRRPQVALLSWSISARHFR